MLSKPGCAGVARIALWLLPAALSACAGGVGPIEKIVIDSEPQGARVFVTGREVGVTPVSLDLEEAFPRHWTKRMSDEEEGFAIYRRLETVELKKEGCEPFKKVLAEGAIDREVFKFALKCDPNYKPAPPAPLAQPAGSIEERLRTLDELKRKGLVTDDEYRAQRTRILGGI